MTKEQQKEIDRLTRNLSTLTESYNTLNMAYSSAIEENMHLSEKVEVYRIMIKKIHISRIQYEKKKEKTVIHTIKKILRKLSIKIKVIVLGTKK